MNSPRSVVCLLAVAAMAVWLSSPGVSYAEAEPLVVEGRVTNATPDGGGVTGVTVILHRLSTSSNSAVEAVTDADGRFRFEEIEFDPKILYGISVEYQGAFYGTDVDLSSGSPAPIMLTIYDAVDTEDVVTASTASVLLTAADESTQMVSALEIVKLVNDSSHTYVPGPEPMALIRFGLTEGAQDLQVDTTDLLGPEFIQVDRGFALLTSVPPGEHEVVYTYNFPYLGTEVPFTKSFAYGVERLQVLAPVDLLNLSGDGLGDVETVTVGGREYQLLKASALPRGARIYLRLEDLPQRSFTDKLGERFDGVRFEYTAPVGLGLFMAFLIGYAMWRQVGERRRQAAGFETGTTGDDERRTLRRMIADLDRGFKAGSVTEEEHRRRSAALDTALASLEGD